MHAPRSGRPRRSLAAGLLLVALVTVGTAPSRALDLDLDAPYIQQGRVWVQARLLDPFAPRVEESLGRGMPARLQVSAELWRRRTGWFDQLSGSFAASLKIRYDVWSRSYRLEGGGLRPEAVSSLDSVRLVLSRPMALPVTTLDRFPRRGRYYVVASATLQPLSVEDVEEGEGWLSGEVVEKRRAGLGVLTAIPRSVFDAVRNLAGLGDQRIRVITSEFEIGQLAER